MKKQFFRHFRRALSLLLCAALLASLFTVFAVKETDFQLILDAGDRSVCGVYLVTQPKFYAETVYPFDGDYALYRDIQTGGFGIVDYRGNIIVSPRTEAPYPVKYLCDNRIMWSEHLYEIDWQGQLPYYAYGYLGDNQGNVLPGLEEVGIKQRNCGVCQDRVTGEQYVWIGQFDVRGTEKQGNTGYVPMARRLVNSDGAILYYSNDIFMTVPVNGVCVCCEVGGRSYGLKDVTGAELIPMNCDYLRFLTTDLVLCLQNQAWTVRRTDGGVVRELPYDSMSNTAYGIIAKKDGKWGVLNTDLDVIIPLEYDSVQICDCPPFRFIGTVGETEYMISENPEMTYCGGRNFPNWTNVLAQDRYLICEDDDLYAGDWYLVDGQGQHLIPDVLCSPGGYRCGDRLYLFLKEPEVTRIYDLDLNLLEEKPGTIVPDGNSYARTCTDETGKNYVEFYNEVGDVIKTINGVSVRHINRFGLGLRREDGMCAFCSPQGELLTDYIYSGIDEISSGSEELTYPYSIGVITSEDSSQKHYMIDVRTGKNAIMENAEVDDSVYAIYPGTYFPFYVNGKIGFARVTPEGESPFRDVGESSWYTEAVKFCYNAGLMSGMGEGEFGPKVTMNRAMLVSVLYRISGEKTASHGFTDVPEGKWYTDAVNWAASLGIVSGKTETSFCPKDPVTREQMVTILYNYACLFGEQAADLSLLDSFEDAGRVGNYARTPMAWAVSVGVISGRTPTTLDPKGNATRAEIASILMRFIRYMAA